MALGLVFTVEFWLKSRFHVFATLCKDDISLSMTLIFLDSLGRELNAILFTKGWNLNS